MISLKDVLPVPELKPGKIKNKSEVLRRFVYLENKGNGIFANEK